MICKIKYFTNHTPSPMRNCGSSEIKVNIIVKNNRKNFQKVPLKQLTTLFFCVIINGAYCSKKKKSHERDIFYKKMRTRDTEKYNEIIETINDLFFENGQVPSTREIGEAIGMPNGTLMRYLNWMREEGMIDFDDGKARSIMTDVIRKSKVKSKPIPIVGSIACGTPALAEENIDSYISLSTEFLGRGQCFFLRASGESMINAGIDDGDLVLIKQQQSAWDGQIVVALTEDGETTLKRFYRDDKLKKIRLRPENDSMEDILVESCQIQGVAIKVIKDL